MRRLRLAAQSPRTPTPPLEDDNRILKVIRTGVDRLWLTGGEPLMHPQILELLAYARHELKFKEISLITNGTLLFERSNLLTLLDRLILSLDSTDPRALNSVSIQDVYADAVIASARQAASLQKEHKFKLIVNAVITPVTLPGMEKLLAFCLESKALISFSPQSVNNLP